MSNELSVAIPSEWIRCTLGELCSERGGSIQTGPFGSQLHAEDYRDEGTPIITVEHLREGKILHTNLPLVGTIDSARLGRYSLSEGDLVFSRVGAIDRCAFVTDAEQGWLFSGRCLRVRFGKGNAYSKFLAYALNSAPRRKWILNHSVGSTMACLNTSIISGVPIELPPNPEQHRIAEILRTLDETIEETGALIAKYLQIKAGLMQDLFTRGVTPDGRLRPTQVQAPHLYTQSPLGWIPDDWKVARVSDITARIEQGWSPDCESEPAEHLEWGVLKTSAVTWAGFNVRENKRLPRHLRPREDLRIRKGDILMTRAGPNSRVGVIALVDVEPGFLMLSDKIYRIIPDNSLSAEYLAHALSSSETQHDIESHKTGLAESQTNISQRIVRRLRVPLPPTTERDAICARIQSSGTVLQLALQESGKLQSMKTGLMNDLLTGRVRVKVAESEDTPA